MKTAIIWNEIEQIKYTVLDGDYRKYHMVYINSTDSDEQLINELDSIFFTETGVCKVNFISIDQFADSIRNGAFLIECGFIP